MRAFTEEIVETGKTTIRLSGARFDFGTDPDAASSEIAMAPGCFAVEMCPPPHEGRTSSGLFVAARDEWTDRPDAGILVGVPSHGPTHADGRRARSRFSFRVGQAVVVDHEPGQRVDGAVFGDYEATEEVRLYGCVVKQDGMANPYPWPRCILMSESENGFLVMGNWS